MKNITEINPYDYESFYYLGDVSDTNLQVKTSNGYINIDNYEIINTSSGKIIGFTRVIPGHHNYFCSLNSKNINLTYFDQMFDILDKKPFETFKFFLFVDSVEMPAYEEFAENFNRSKTVDGNVPIRCDYNQYGGFAFDLPENGYTILKLMNALNIAGVGHVAYFETAENENTNPYHVSINHAARTYAGILKTIYEWSVVADQPFNNQEKIAQKAKLMWEQLELPEDLKNWIINDYCDMRVSRFLKGETEIIQDVEAEEQMPEVLSNYIKSNCKYRTLSSLANSHPDNIVIPSSILEDEKNTIENQLYDFVVRNNINYQNKNYLDILNIYLNNKKSLKYSVDYDIQKLMEKTTCIQRTL
jgi:hypothetical protein